MYAAEIFSKRDKERGKTSQINDYFRHADTSLDSLRDIAIIVLVITIKIQTHSKRLAWCFKRLERHQFKE